MVKLFKSLSYGNCNEHLLDGVSACTDDVANSVVIFSDRDGQLFCTHPLYLSFNRNFKRNLFLSNFLGRKIVIVLNHPTKCCNTYFGSFLSLNVSIF